LRRVIVISVAFSVIDYNGEFCASCNPYLPKATLSHGREDGGEGNSSLSIPHPNHKYEFAHHLRKTTKEFITLLGN